jgi:hypothetical protein
VQELRFLFEAFCFLGSTGKSPTKVKSFSSIVIVLSTLGFSYVFTTIYSKLLKPLQDYLSDATSTDSVSGSAILALRINQSNNVAEKSMIQFSTLEFVHAGSSQLRTWVYLCVE